MSAAIEAKDRELETFREGQLYDEFSDETHHTRQNRILYVLTLKSCVSKYSRLKKTSTGRRGIAMSLSTRFKDCGRSSVRTQPLWRPNESTSAHTRTVSAVSRASTMMLLLNSTRRTTKSVGNRVCHPSHFGPPSSDRSSQWRVSRGRVSQHKG